MSTSQNTPNNDSLLKELAFKDPQKAYTLLINEQRRSEFLKEYRLPLESLFQIISATKERYNGAILEGGKALYLGCATIDGRHHEMKHFGISGWEIDWGTTSDKSEKLSAFIAGTLLGTSHRVSTFIDMRQRVLDAVVSKLDTDTPWKIHSHDILNVLADIKRLNDVVEYAG